MPCGRMKLRDESLRLGAGASGIAQPIAQLADVLLERGRDPDAAAVLGQQVVEVDRPFLRAGKLLPPCIENTGRPMIAASIIALVLMPTTAAEW